MAIQYQVYFKLPGGDWQSVENTYATAITIPDAILDVLEHFSVYQWRVDTYDDESELTTTGDTWTFISSQALFITSYKRRSDYNADYVWNPSIGDWDDINDFEYTGGGRYKGRLVVVGHGVVYYGSL